MPLRPGLSRTALPRSVSSERSARATAGCDVGSSGNRSHSHWALRSSGRDSVSSRRVGCSRRQVSSSSAMRSWSRSTCRRSHSWSSRSSRSRCSPVWFCSGAPWPRDPWSRFEKRRPSNRRNPWRRSCAAEDGRGHPHGAHMRRDRHAARAAHLQSAPVRHRRVRPRAHLERHRRERRLADGPRGPEQLQTEGARGLPPLGGGHIGAGALSPRPRATSPAAARASLRHPPVLAIPAWAYYSAVDVPFLADLLAADALVLFLGIVILLTALIAPTGRPARPRTGQRFVSPVARGILVPAIGVLVVLGNARNGLFAGAVGTQSGLLQMLPAIGVLAAFGARNVTTDQRLADVGAMWFGYASDSSLPVKLRDNESLGGFQYALALERWTTVGAQVHPAPNLVISAVVFENFLAENRIVYAAGPSGDRIFIVQLRTSA